MGYQPKPPFSVRDLAHVAPDNTEPGNLPGSVVSYEPNGEFMRTDDLGVARHLAEPRERGVVIDADGVDVTLHPYEAAQRLLKYLAKEILGAGWIVGDDFLNHRFSVTRYGRPEEGLHHVPEEVAEHGEEAIRANLEAFKATLGG